MVALLPRALLPAAALLILASAPAAARPAHGLDREACRNAVAYSEQLDGVSLLVLHHGRVVCEAHRSEADANTAHELWSGTKSFAGVMALLAEQDELLNLDAPVASVLPEWQDGSDRATITIRQLLTLTSGIVSEVGLPPTYADSLRARPQAPPGTLFSYGPAPFQIFGEALRRRLVAQGRGSDPAVWFTRRLLDPIGVEVGQWRRGTDGQPLLPQGMALTAANWARFGEWIRKDGQGMVPAGILAALRQGTAANPGYGLTWWVPSGFARAPAATRMPPAVARSDFDGIAVPEDMLMAGGAGNQRLYVIPSAGLTIVRFSEFRPRLKPGTAVRARQWSDGAFLGFFLDPQARHAESDQRPGGVRSGGTRPVP